MITASHLSYQTNGKFLLDDLSFEIAEGEYAVIIGLNGAGKTTLIRCLARLWEGWTGEILLNGRSVRDFSRRDLAQTIAVVGQMPEVPPYTVRQYVTLARYPHLGAWTPLERTDRDAVDDSLYKTGMTDLANRALSTLSGGELRKANLAAALSQKTDLLLLDEIAAFLDYRHENEIAALLSQLNKSEKKTIIEVTHDLNRAVLQADHLIALNYGKIVFDGPSKEIMTPERLLKIFGTPLITVPHPENQIPMIIPSSMKNRL